MDNDIFKKFTPNLKKTLIDAEKIARDRNINQDTEHQLMAILQNKDTLAAEILASFDVTVDRVELISSLISHKNSDNPSIITDSAKKSIQLAVQTALKYHHANVGSEHLLLALISNKIFNSYLILERIGVEPRKIRKQVEAIFSGINKSFNQVNTQPNISPMINPQNLLEDDGFDEPFFGTMPQIPGLSNQPQKKESTLDIHSTNLTTLARNKKLDPVIGRDREIHRLIQTLSRRTKNNPVLVGEPGVGKTAIVEGLAQKIVRGDVPEKITDAEILSLDLGSILAGTMYRGQFESRVKKILAEIEKRQNIILFVDEIHMIVGAGSTEGSVDAANLLKPMLAKGKLHLIGSTTFNEYKKYIEKDAAFERRFQPIKVAEPSKEETLKILQGIKGYYEEFHKVKYAPEALLAAVDFSTRYIHDRSLPDKAIDLIDEAGAAKNSHIKKADPVTPLKKELMKVLKEKESLIIAEKYEEATLLREKTIKLQDRIQLLGSRKPLQPEIIVSMQDIADLVSEWTGVPVTTMTFEEKKNYLNLEKKLKHFVIGQNEAISELAKAIKRARTGIANPARPIGSFIFLGPTGVGKTELAKVLAKEIFGTDKALVKIDMSEFSEKHNVARLIGAPAGYVGYEEGGKLTEKIRQNPYSVILFDEIEKAHPEVFNILLQIMDDGTLTDAKGRSVDFKNTIIIMTSNLGTDIIRRQAAIGFGHSKSDQNKYEMMRDNVIETVEKTFRPEFINRLDKIIVFSSLNKATVRKIVDLQLAELIKRLENKKIKLIVPVKVRNLIAEKSYSEDYGARPVRKFITDYIETLLSDKLLEAEITEETVIKLAIKDGKINLEQTAQ
ncbi:MAG: ATP-dependent Clp protease ATP-binding subunit [bacterium]|nr:ATP-dependent Clp protease ATP-binding subunit [bacterium]